MLYRGKPPMGWNSWDCYGDSVNEEQLLANAAALAALKDYGWQYVVCDIQWSEPTADGYAYHNFAELCMDDYSRLIPSPERFPSAANGAGFRPIADKVHAMGLKFGIHIMRGIPRQAVHRNTPLLGTAATARDIAQQYSICPWNTDMYGVDPDREGAQAYYDSLLALYAEWGVDYIKCDDIANTEFLPHNPYSARRELELLTNAVEKADREIVLSLSPGPAPLAEHEHLAAHATMWRVSGDFWDQWPRLLEMFALCRAWAPYVRDGAYPDCDMLPLGTLTLPEGARRTRFTPAEQRTMLSLWGIFRSPLMIGAELTMADPFTLSVLCNRDVLTMNQTCRNPRELCFDDTHSIWLADGEGCQWAALFNLSDETRTLTLPDVPDGADICECWQGSALQAAGGRVSVSVGAHDAAVLKIVDKA